MVAMPETIETGPPPILNDPARDPLNDEERAELIWGDEALTSCGDVSVSACDGMATLSGHVDTSARTWRPPYPFAANDSLWARP
jgi:hypothetical protein